MTDNLIVNAQLVNEGQTFTADLRMRGGTIETFAPELTARAHETVIDAKGHWLLPGLVEAQVHFREPDIDGLVW